eukprot:scaffold11094_cov39-Prasinocladus_malaysianus.AAC.1
MADLQRKGLGPLSHGHRGDPSGWGLHGPDHLRGGAPHSDGGVWPMLPDRGGRCWGRQQGALQSAPVQQGTRDSPPLSISVDSGHPSIG